MGGQNVIGHEVMERLAVLLQKNKNIAEANEDLLADMTEREKEICTLLAKGLNNRQIADELYISEGTVKIIFLLYMIKQEYMTVLN